MAWRRWIVVGAGALGVLVSLAIYFNMASREAGLLEARFRIDAAARLRSIEHVATGNVEVLHSVVAFYAGSKTVERDEFRAFSAPLLGRHTTIRALEWAPVVRRSSLAAHVAEVQADSSSDYAVRPLPDADPDPRDVLVPVMFAEPHESGNELLGLDLASEPTRRAALEAARDSGEVVASAPIRLVRPDGKAERPGFLLVAPIYANGTDTSTMEARRAHHLGYAVAALHMGDLAAHALGLLKATGIAMHLVDPAVPPPNRLLYTQETGDDWKGSGDRKISTVLKFSVGGRSFELRCSPTARYLKDQRQSTASLALAVMLALAGLAVSYLALMSSRTSRIERLVAERTEALRQVTRLQQGILDGADHTIISTDPHGTILTFNDAAERTLGYRAEEMVGRQTPAILHRAEEVRAHAEALTKRLGRKVEPGFEAFVALAAEGAPDVNEWTYVRRDGSEFPVRLSVTALRDDGGRITGFLGIGNDITRDKESERELQAATAAADHANRAKSQFLANMSHELRTPLNAIIGYSELLEEDARAAGRGEVAEDLRKIRHAGRHLLQLINDVLDLSKVEAGRVELYPEPIDIAAMCEEVAMTVRPLVAQKENSFAVRCAPDAGTMESDLTRVRQILFNLLSNAAKFTEKGEVALEASAVGAGDEIVFRVRDTGIGMSPDQLAKVFEPFAQADSSTTRRYGGTGLGLAICREYSLLLGGEITAESALGEGAVFTLRLPRRRFSVPPAPPVDPPPRGDLVLVIDDDPAVHDVMRRILSKEGYAVIGAAGGEAGLMLARERRPKAIVVDVVMPSMDGWAVLAALKSDPDLAATPVILQTMVEDRTMGYALGAADFLVKPVDREHLLAALRRCQTVPGRVLVVEDDTPTRELMRRTLEKEGWVVDEATDGAAALDRLAARVPDLVLADLMMSPMDGFELIDRMQGSDAWRHVPVLVVTAKALSPEERTRLRGRVAGILEKGAYARKELIEEVCRRAARAAGGGEGAHE